jgi:hypothetical protein
MTPPYEGIWADHVCLALRMFFRPSVCFCHIFVVCIPFACLLVSSLPLMLSLFAICLSLFCIVICRSTCHLTVVLSLFASHLSLFGLVYHLHLCFSPVPCVRTCLRSVYVFLSVSCVCCLSVCLSLCLLTNIFACDVFDCYLCLPLSLASTCLSICLSILPSTCLIFQSVCLCICFYVRLSLQFCWRYVCPSICLPICLSFHQSVLTFPSKRCYEH